MRGNHLKESRCPALVINRYEYCLQYERKAHSPKKEGKSGAAKWMALYCVHVANT